MTYFYEDNNGDVYRVTFEYGLYRCECRETGDQCNFDKLPKSWRKI